MVSSRESGTPIDIEKDLIDIRPTELLRGRLWPTEESGFKIHRSAVEKRLNDERDN
jgi:hypothetical protein